MFPVSRASTVCLTVRTPAFSRAPAAANPEVNSAAKLKITTDSDSTGIRLRTAAWESAMFRTSNTPFQCKMKTRVKMGKIQTKMVDILFGRRFQTP